MGGGGVGEGLRPPANTSKLCVHAAWRAAGGEPDDVCGLSQRASVRQDLRLSCAGVWATFCLLESSPEAGDPHGEPTETGLLLLSSSCQMFSTETWIQAVSEKKKKSSKINPTTFPSDRFVRRWKQWHRRSFSGSRKTNRVSPQSRPLTPHPVSPCPVGRQRWFIPLTFRQLCWGLRAQRSFYLLWLMDNRLQKRKTTNNKIPGKKTTPEKLNTDTELPSWKKIYLLNNIILKRSDSLTTLFYY